MRIYEYVGRPSTFVPFDITNVAQFFYEHDQIEWESGDFHCVAPPFERFWMEFRIPPKMLTDGGMKNCTGGGHCHAAAYWVREDAIPNTVRASLLRTMCEETRKKNPDARWVYAVDFLAEDLNGVVRMMPKDVVGGVAIAADGSLLGKWFASPQGPPDGKVISSIQAGQLLPMLLALSFINCKNVARVENRPPRAERRRAEREGRPCATYYTLSIDPMRKVLTTEGRAGEVGLSRAMHICRGHFATYVPERAPRGWKLEGPTQVWRSQHTKGKPENGVVKKDYSVEAPTNLTPAE